jgi:hypothetical protein
MKFHKSISVCTRYCVIAMVSKTILCKKRMIWYYEINIVLIWSIHLFNFLLCCTLKSDFKILLFEVSYVSHLNNAMPRVRWENIRFRIKLSWFYFLCLIKPRMIVFFLELNGYRRYLKCKINADFQRKGQDRRIAK